MALLPLPWLAERLGRPAYCRAEPLVAAPGDDAPIPPGALVLEATWPPARILLGLPASAPGAPCYEPLPPAARRDTQLAWAEWVDRFLAACLVRPRLDTPEAVAWLGQDREPLAVGLLRLWGWVPEDDGRILRLGAPPVRALLRQLARQTRRLPSELLERPLPALVFDWRVMSERETPREPALPPELAAIGIEEPGDGA
ncbi:MAG TPA: hypothetical protein VNJ53_13080 [Gaiellaceae bacterium]|nr:hypothetical protein [Gaiellaceae bacterium]